MTDQIDQMAADLEQLHRQHAGELSDLVERQAGERAELVARMRIALATAEPATDVEPRPSKPRRSYRPTGTEEWMHVVHAAHELGFSRSKCWREAGKHGAQFPHSTQHVDISRLRYLSPRARGKIEK